MCCRSVTNDILLEGGYGGLDVAIQDIQLEKPLECFGQVLDTGYCNTNVFNLGNWDVATCRIQ